MRILLWVVTVLFFMLSWWWYVCPHKQVCPFGDYAVNRPAHVLPSSDTEIRSKMEFDHNLLDSMELKAFQKGAVYFHWSDDKPHVSDGFAEYRDSILNNLEESDLLKIVGKYYIGENNSTAFPNLGYARATKLKLLFRSLPSNRFQLESSRMREHSTMIKEKPFSAALFRRVIQNASIRDLGGKVIINFPHASNEMMENPEVNAYLSDLVKQLKDTDELVLVVGHTDNTASSQRNLSLGWKRANSIRSLLLRKGLPSVKILTESHGEAHPIASNRTAEGREKNRRVEVTIIKDLN